MRDHDQVPGFPDHGADPAIPTGERPRPQGSIWITGQVCSREQRRHRYAHASMVHPAKMLPSIARYAIATYTSPGDWVLDPMCGIATTLVEAMHLGRHSVGVEYEKRWVRLGAENLRRAIAQGATGHGDIIGGDARVLPALLPPELHGRVSLVLTSPPYGPHTHGQVRTPGPRRGKVRKIHHRYGHDPTNLAYAEAADLAEGFTRILTGCAAILRPGGHVVVTARPWRHHGVLLDLPGVVHACGEAAGLRLIDRCAALIAGVRGGRLVPRASFFQLRNLRAAHALRDPQWLIAHEDALVFQQAKNRLGSAEPACIPTPDPGGAP
ncbi:MAG: site-specific DNA-methyltransferase [Dactylosporangium sp.]|nr:site-specific DNA-methyltransferase [Dactylosporangium sp.]NNJ63221.1 site-specific DNA-methyltransferase [Dactylosporangium sp.]